jgi:hypothetical protein
MALLLRTVSSSSSPIWPALAAAGQQPLRTGAQDNKRKEAPPRRWVRATKPTPLVAQVARAARETRVRSGVAGSLTGRA